MNKYDEEHPIIWATGELAKKYPVEYRRGSRASLWYIGLEEGLIPIELYREALAFYGDLWDYVRD
jgi:hypothetical protein